MLNKEQIEELKAKCKEKEIQLSYPGVIKAKRPWGEEIWLTLWLSDGIPQHCICENEEQALWKLSYELRDRI